MAVSLNLKGLLAGLVFTGVLASQASATVLNVAQLYGVASQSSTAYGGDASKAIDGNTDGNYNNGSVTHTGLSNASTGNYATWQVALDKDYAISEIKVWNRTDAESDDLSSFYVSIINSANVETYSQLYTTVPSPMLDITFSGGGTRQGDVVQIFLTRDADYLQLAEVQVFADNGIGPVPEPASLALLAFGAVASYGAARRRKTGDI